MWSKQLEGADSYAVILFNRTDTTQDISVMWSHLGLSTNSALVRDLWARTDVGVVEGGYTAPVPSHGVVMLRVNGE